MSKNQPTNQPTIIIFRSLSLYIYIYIYRLIGIVGRVFTNGPGGWGLIPGQVVPKFQKMVLDAVLLNDQHYKVHIKGKWNNSGEGVVPLPIPWCSSYWKRSLRVALDYGQPTNTTYIYIYIYIYISVATLAYFCYSCPPPPSVNFSSQPVVRGPKVSHHSCYCVILHCIAQIDKRTLHGVFL